LLGAFWTVLAARREEADRVAGLEDVMGSCYTERRLFCSVESSGAEDKSARFNARARGANSGLGREIPAAQLGKLMGL
jgi:Glu-tRNA(Gln) amidotransferase subunit E-like FAD-binding protein